MDQTTFEIDGNNFEDFAGFIVEFDRKFVSQMGGRWSGNLDAFSDFLSWGDTRSTIRWVNSTKSRSDLGHAAIAQWLAANLLRCHPLNRAAVQRKLEDAKRERGPTMFDWLIEIIRESKDFVDLELA